MATLKAYLTTDEAAALAGIAPSTFRKYVSGGQAPAPLHPRSGLYNGAENVAWASNRPGRGFRTDLHRRPR